MNSLPENLCVVPFVHMSSKPNGACRLCCFSTKYIKNKQNEQLFLGKHSFQEIWNSEDMRTVRKKMLNNEKLSECRHCWNEEKNQKSSKRIKENKRFLKNYSHYLDLSQEKDGFLSEPPPYLDLRLGNVCNIKCRTCNPLFSSAWVKELEKNEKDFKKNEFLKQTYEDILISSKEITNWYDTEFFFDIIKAVSPALKLIYLSGGEPLLIKKHHSFVDYFIKKGVHKNIAVNMNTNLTYLDKKLLEKLSGFKRLHFSVSIDAYGEKNNYIRSPSQFLKIEKNMEQVLQQQGNIEVSINCTVSVYNILYLSELIDWSRDLQKKYSKKSVVVYFDLLHKPLFQQISVLPHSLKEEAINKLKALKNKNLFPRELEDIKSFINSLQFSLKEKEENLRLRNQLREHINFFDTLRKESFFTVFPDFKGHL